MKCLGGWKSEQVDGEGIYEKKVTFDSRPEGSEEANPTEVWGKSDFQVEGTAKSELPREEHTWHAWARRTVKPEHREQDDEPGKCNREVMGWG